MDTYLVQNDGDVSKWPEKKLRKKLRNGDLSGLELVRLEHESQWQPLHDLAIFGEEVPHQGDPRRAAQRRVVKSFAWHVGIYAVITSIFFGPLSWPGMIWGLFLIGHAAKALPVGWALARSGPALGPGSSPTALPAASPPGLPPATNALPPTPEAPAVGFAADVQEVRALLDRRPEPAAAPIVQELDRMVTAVDELASTIARLTSLLERDDREQLERDLRAAEVARDQAEAPEDATLRGRQVQVLHQRLEADARARRTLERLRLREDLAHQQVQQLRLDLVRTEARDAGTEDLGPRLEQIRLEAEAMEEVEGLLGR